jgi:hypothetical protein
MITCFRGSAITVDALIFFVFALIGSNQHGESMSLIQILLVALPFLLAWFIVATSIGVYRTRTCVALSSFLTMTMLSWLLALCGAMILRGFFVDHAVPPLSFMIIAFFFNGVLLLANHTLLWFLYRSFLTKALSA